MTDQFESNDAPNNRSKTTRKPASLFGMEPAGDVESYRALPWFRKQEFALFPLLLPATIVIALTGDVFHNASPKMKEHSDANVWRYTGVGRAVFIGVSVVVLVVALLAFFG